MSPWPDQHLLSGDTYSQEVCIKTQLFKDNGYTYKPALKCVEWLSLYFKKDPTLHTLPLPAICSFLKKSNKGATFTSRVLHNLAHKIKYGQTVSYGALGKLSGSPTGACRAVGQAMRNNPVQILIPCHRVIEASGKIGNYSGGSKNNTKVWLLQLEGVLKT
ncbi:unnamed protein product [Owenia fusiformis]|uniref:Methylated-DNA--protein-cysteine methyltransferase n=1 Tax=Owenia fusiformis TaxID=6347 RepID=A0A8S4PRA0_OWEFU|nr:unnamed protein product [Owenia fusiformis]